MRTDSSEAEQETFNLKVVGSIPTRSKLIHTLASSSEVEHLTVNQVVAGSIPASPANMFPSSSGLGHPPFTQVTRVRLPLETYTRNRSSVVRTLPCHGRGRGFKSHRFRHYCFLSGCSSARLERLFWEQEVVGSNPATPTFLLMEITMTLFEAYWILTLRKHGHSYRSIAELHAQATNTNDTTQHRGRELVIEAAKELNLTENEVDELESNNATEN